MVADDAIGLEELARLLSHQDPRRRLEGLRRITAIGRYRSLDERGDLIPLLAPLAEDKEAFVRWNFVLALDEIGHPQVIPLLVRLSDDGHTNVRIRVALALALIGMRAGWRR